MSNIRNESPARGVEFNDLDVITIFLIINYSIKFPVIVISFFPVTWARILND